MKSKSAIVVAAVCAALLSQAASADFVEQFKGDKLTVDPQAHRGWAFFTGSGEATISFTQKNGVGIVDIDARRDRRNIWWAAIKRAISPYIDRSALGRPGTALRIETKIRLSAAPRRVTLGLNHTRTTDYHINLAEFDIPDTGWHVISYTDKTFDAAPSDEVFAQLSTMDAGRERYRIEIAYYKVSVVDAKTAPPDLGGPLDYRPKLPPLESYANIVPVLQDAIVDSAYPWVNFKSWSNMSGDGRAVLAVNSSMTSLLRWDLSRFKGRVPDGWGVLELTTDAVHRAPTDLEEFGYVRAVEIKGGAPDWERATVTRDSFFQGKPDLDVLNGQLMIDVPPALHRGEKTLIAVSPPVLRRLLSGKTKGLALLAQGEIYVSFASSQSPDERARPKLYFNVK